VLHYSNYVWRYGVQHRGVDGRPGESLFPSDVMACLVLAHERLRGWLYGNVPFGLHPYADSRVRLTDGRMVHNCGRGDVLSSRVPTASGMASQGPGWLHSDGDGCTGPEVMGETRPTGLMSRRCPARAWGRCPYPFRGFRCPLSRVRRAGRTEAGGIVSQS
jgi:hypothetical protein